MTDPGEEVVLGREWEGVAGLGQATSQVYLCCGSGGTAWVKVLRPEGLPGYQEASRAGRGQSREARWAWGGVWVFFIL